MSGENCEGTEQKRERGYSDQAASVAGRWLRTQEVIVGVYAEKRNSHIKICILKNRKCSSLVHHSPYSHSLRSRGPRATIDGAVRSVRAREEAGCCTSDSLMVGMGGKKRGSKQGADGPPLGGREHSIRIRGGRGEHDQ